MSDFRVENKLKQYKYMLIALGGCSIVFSIVRLVGQPFDQRWITIALFSIIVSHIAASRIPNAKNAITVSDTFIFLSLLVSGPAAGILVAAVAAASDSARHAKRLVTLFVNIAVTSLSLFAASQVVILTVGNLSQLAHRKDTFFPYVLGVLLIALSHGFINTLLLTPIVTIRSGGALLRTWYDNYAWVMVTPISGATIAAVVFALIHYFGFWAVLFTVPLILTGYLAARPYLKNIEAAELHVAELTESESRFRNAFEHSAVGMGLVDQQGHWVQVNTALCRILGYSASELVHQDFHSIIHEEDLGQALVKIHQLMEGQISGIQMEQRCRQSHGGDVWVIWSVSLDRDIKTKEKRLIFQLQDISDRKRAESQLLHDAFHDGLTGLPNRALFLDHLRMAIERRKRDQNKMFAVLFLDFDRFKLVNDSLGHTVGDQLLVALARRLETCLRPGDTVARLGGDEFTVLLDDLRNFDEVIDVAQRINTALDPSYYLNGNEVFITASMGISCSDFGYDNPEDLLRDADTAMYRAKACGTARYEIFDKAMHSQVTSRLQLEGDLRRAIERNEFFLQYQPIVSLDDGSLKGFEALVRWQHPEQGLVSPTSFIPVAEETGLILEIGHWVLREACRQVAQWHNEFPHSFPLQVSVNLSSRQFAQPDLIDRIRTVIHEVGLDPSHLKLELTESAVMENVEAVTRQLREIRQLGIQLSIDDFGTGYSSLSYLYRFPINTLKIDRSFVIYMSEEENTDIVRTIVSLAESLGMEVIAEGVETIEQLRQLQTLKCGFAQGYYFAKPLSHDAAGEMVRDKKQWQIGVPVLNEAYPEAALLQTNATA